MNERQNQPVHPPAQMAVRRGNSCGSPDSSSSDRVGDSRAAAAPLSWSVVIPVHNLHKRGHDRLKWSLLSLSLQRTPPKDVIIPDSSDASGALAVDLICKIAQQWQGLTVTHLRLPRDGFNMPFLFNRGIEAATSDYLLCTGADFLYHPRYGDRLMALAKSDTFVISEVGMLPSCIITEDTVRRWRFPSAKPNEHGRLADGVQFAPIWFFRKIGGYDENMAGWGGMDNDMHNRAKLFGMREVWLPRMVLHQYHRVEKGSGQDLKQSQRNWRLRDAKGKSDIFCTFVSEGSEIIESEHGKDKS